MKRNVKVVILILLFIMVIIILRNIVNKPDYSKEEIISMLNIKVTENMYFKFERIYEDKKTSNIIEMYAKDDKLYKHEKSIDIDQEFLFDFENKTEKIVDNKTKTFHIYPTDDSMNPLIIKLNSTKELLEKSKEKYKYYGKELVEEKECIKFSLSNKNIETIYYLDVDNSCIIKIEYYDNMKKKSEDLFTYTYDIVTDENISDFDINNYPDYEFKN